MVTPIGKLGKGKQLEINLKPSDNPPADGGPVMPAASWIEELFSPARGWYARPFRSFN